MFVVSRRVKSLQVPTVALCLYACSFMQVRAFVSGSWKTVGMSNDDLIEGLKKYKVITKEIAVRAMKEVDRGQYVKDKDKYAAYVDAPQAIGQTISAPHMHVVAMESLSENLVPGAKVLDVGSGSGYLTACFGKLVGPNGRVVGIERLPSLVKWGTSNIKKANPELLESGTVKLVQGDGWQGYPEEAPYDAIHVGAASESLPEKLVDQLKKGGRMIIPVGKKSQYLLQVDKDGEGEVTTTRLFEVRYVPLVKEVNKDDL